MSQGEFTSRERNSAAPRRTEHGYEMQRDADGHVVMQWTGDEPRPGKDCSIDPARYPSPRKLRRVLSFVLDMVLHLACGVIVALALSPMFSVRPTVTPLWVHRPGEVDLNFNPVVTVAFWLLASFVDRVAIQTVVHTTVGKAVFGLVALAPDGDGFPSFGRLLKNWSTGLWLIVFALGDAAGPDDDGQYFLPAVRWRDLSRAGAAGSAVRGR
jgi:hypothetical protein